MTRSPSNSVLTLNDAAFKPMLKAYINYAHTAARHAASLRMGKPRISYRETEVFVYQTGVYLRLAMSAEPSARRPTLAEER